MSSSTPRLLDASYRTLTVGTLAIASLGAFEYLAVATAMPTVARELDGLGLYALAFSGSLAAGVVGMVVAGAWGDSKGAGPPMWSGVAWFTIGLIVAGTAPAMWVLVLGRIVQGFGAGLQSVALYVVVGHSYPADLRPRIFGAFAAAWVIPSMLGPVVTGLIIEYAGWRWVFLGVALLVVPAAAVLRTAVGSRSIHTNHDATWSMSQIAWALWAATAVCVLYIGGHQSGLMSGVIVAGALIAVGISTPRLLPIGTMRLRRGLPAVIGLRGIAAAAFFEAEIYVPLMLSRTRGFSPAAAGFALTVGALSWAGGSWYQGRSQQPFRRVTLLRSGMFFIGFGVACQALTMWQAVPSLVAVAGWAIAGLGMGIVYPTLSVLTLELSPSDKQGVNSSALQLSDSIFSASVLAVGGILFAALVARWETTAYVSCFGIGVLFAILGMFTARRAVGQA